MWATIEKVAKEQLGIENTNTRHSDALDFHTLSVWEVRAAIEAAYRTGYTAGANDAKGIE